MILAGLFVQSCCRTLRGCVNGNHHLWQLARTSPYHNAVVLLDNAATITPPATVTATVTSKTVTKDATTLVINISSTETTRLGLPQYIETDDNASKGVGVHRNGMIIIPMASEGTNLSVNVLGKTYNSEAAALVKTLEVGGTIELTAQ